MPCISFPADSHFGLGQDREQQPAKSSSRPVAAATALKRFNFSNSAACSAPVKEGWRRRGTQRQTLLLPRQRRLSAGPACRPRSWNRTEPICGSAVRWRYRDPAVPGWVSQTSALESGSSVLPRLQAVAFIYTYM